MAYSLDVLFVIMIHRFRKPSFPPFRKAVGITVNVLIAKLDSHPGCGVAPDSGQSRSVKDH
jgi:hypothetical protein